MQETTAQMKTAQMKTPTKLKQAHRKTASYGFAALTVIVWATLATVSKILLGSIDVMLVLAVNSVVATVVLFFYSLFRGTLKDFGKCSARDLFTMCFLGFIGFFLYNWFYLLGIKQLPSQQAMVINYLWPALIIVFSAIIFKQRMTWKKIVAVVCSLVGVTIVAMNGDPSALIGGNWKGVLFCLVAAICYALYASLNKKQTYPKEISMLVVFAVTAVVSSICVFIDGSYVQIPDITGSMWIGLLYSGIAVNAIGYTSWMWALEYGNTAVISNLAYLVPFLSMVVARIVLKEAISVYSIVGLVLIVGGICIQMRDA